MKNISSTKCLFDTNILIYSLDIKSPFYDVSRKLIEEVILGRRIGVLAQQNLVECTNALMHDTNWEKESILSDVRTFGEASNFSIIYPTHNTFNVFLSLCLELENRRKQFFDLYLAATMLDNDINQIITANDDDFAGIPGIKAINPWKKQVHAL